MNSDACNELRKIRNELSHGTEDCDPADLAKRLSQFGIAVPTTNRSKFTIRARLFSNLIPQVLSPVLEMLLEGQEARVVLDPCAGLGAVLATVREATHANVALAFTDSASEAEVGKDLFKSSEWQTGDPLELLGAMSTEVDVVASVLPFGAKHESPIRLVTEAGDSVEIRGDLGHLILAAASARLTTEGIGLFVIDSSLFSSGRSTLRQFEQLGLGIEAALALPFRVYAPDAIIQTYLVIVRKRISQRMFVAQLSNDPHANRQIIENFKQGREGATLELGRIVPVQPFKGLATIRLEERLREAEQQFSAPAIRLKELATSITLGRPGEDFEFPNEENAIFVPLIGNSNVVDSVENRSLKPWNYAQVVVDPGLSNARFVARFLNSELGKEIRDLNKTGVIPKLNKRALQDLRVLVPDLRTQKDMLKIEAQLTAEQNTLLGLQNEIAELRRELWRNPRSASTVERQVHTLANRLSGNLKEQSEERLDQWCETLPFPLASITRAWQATASQDFRGKVDHLLHFFEATTQFLSVILLSAFSSNEAVFDTHRKRFARALELQHLGFQRATFGTWKTVVQFFGKQTRILVEGDMDSRALCADLFDDLSLKLPETLSSKELVGVIERTNTARNDLKGHGGVLGPEEAELRHEQLLTELQRLREVMADVWADIQLIQALHTRARRGLYENEVALMMGSNSEFLKVNRSMPVVLDVDRLYLTHESTGRSLPLLPLVRVGPAPRSATNACYFFNRN